MALPDQDLPFDSRPILGASLTDLDDYAFTSVLLPALLPHEVLAENERSVAQRLAALRLTSADGIPTAAGILAVGIDPLAFVPGAYVQFLRLGGDELDAPIKDEKRLDGTLLDVLRQLDEVLELNITTSVDFTSGAREERIPDYPLVALQQVARNAVLHRSYEHTASPVRITWRVSIGPGDRVEVISPGGPYGIVSAENFGRPGVTDYRNPALADLLRGLGYVQRFGMGLPSTRRSLERNGSPPPEFTVTDSHVSVTIREAAVTPPVITFFNNKGGVGKTTLVYHVAWMLADRGYRVVAADLDPQANLTAAFLDDEEVEQLWNSAESRSIWSAIRPFVDGEGMIEAVTPTPTNDERLALLPGDLALSRFEDDLSDQWRLCLDGTRLRPFLVMSAFWTVLQSVAQRHRAEVVLVDVGPSLGAINRAALVASDHVVVPVAPDLFSLQGLRNLGPTLRVWREGWCKRLGELRECDRPLPAGSMAPLGYVVLDQGMRLDRVVQAYQRWIDKIPVDFHSAVLNDTVPPPEPDPYCLTRLKHYHSLMPLAQEARKPVFALKPADGAFGGHAQATQRAYEDFRGLAMGILTASRASAAP